MAASGAAVCSSSGPNGVTSGLIRKIHNSNIKFYKKVKGVVMCLHVMSKILIFSHSHG